MPKASYIGFSVIAMPVVVQLGMGVMKPLQPRAFCCCLKRAMCSELMPGIKMGTSFSYLKADAVLITGLVAANLGSRICAWSDSMAVNTMSTSEMSISLAFCTGIFMTDESGGSAQYHLNAPVLGSVSESL